MSLQPDKITSSALHLGNNNCFKQQFVFFYIYSLQGVSCIVMVIIFIESHILTYLLIYFCFFQSLVYEPAPSWDSSVPVSASRVMGRVIERPEDGWVTFCVLSSRLKLDSKQNVSSSRWCPLFTCVVEGLSSSSSWRNNSTYKGRERVSAGWSRPQSQINSRLRRQQQQQSYTRNGECWGVALRLGRPRAEAAYFVSLATSTSAGAVIGALECPAVGSSVFSSPLVELITWTCTTHMGVRRRGVWQTSGSEPCRNTKQGTVLWSPQSTWWWRY